MFLCWCSMHVVIVVVMGSCKRVCERPCAGEQKQLALQYLEGERVQCHRLCRFRERMGCKAPPTPPEATPWSSSPSEEEDEEEDGEALEDFLCRFFFLLLELDLFFFFLLLLLLLCLCLRSFCTTRWSSATAGAGVCKILCTHGRHPQTPTQTRQDCVRAPLRL